MKAEYNFQVFVHIVQCTVVVVSYFFLIQLLYWNVPYGYRLADKQPTRPHGRGFAGRQRPKTMTTLFGPTAQTRRLRQPRPAAAAAADQNIQFSSKSVRWGRWKSKESRGIVIAAAAGMWCLVRADGWWEWEGCALVLIEHWRMGNTQIIINTAHGSAECSHTISVL